MTRESTPIRERIRNRMLVREQTPMKGRELIGYLTLSALILLPTVFGLWQQNDFVPGVSREFVRSCPTQLLVMPGVDEFHPERIGREVAKLAPRAELRIPWRDSPERIEETVEHVRAFLEKHTPS